MMPKKTTFKKGTDPTSLYSFADYQQTAQEVQAYEPVMKQVFVAETIAVQTPVLSPSQTFPVVPVEGGGSGTTAIAMAANPFIIRNGHLKLQVADPANLIFNEAITQSDSYANFLEGRNYIGHGFDQPFGAGCFGIEGAMLKDMDIDISGCNPVIYGQYLDTLSEQVDFYDYEVTIVLEYE